MRLKDCNNVAQYTLYPIIFNIMAGNIHRQKKNRDFVTIDTHCLRNKDLKWDAKGLHSYLMQLPDDWKINIADLQKRSLDRHDGTMSPMRALIAAGYVYRERISGEKGRFIGYDYHLFERPEQTVEWLTVNGKSIDGKTVNGKTPTSKGLIPKKVNNNEEGEGKEKKQTPPPETFDEMMSEVERLSVEEKKEKAPSVAGGFPNGNITIETFSLLSEADQKNIDDLRELYFKSGRQSEWIEKMGPIIAATTGVRGIVTAPPPPTLYSGFKEVYDYLESENPGIFDFPECEPPVLVQSIDAETLPGSIIKGAEIIFTTSGKPSSEGQVFEVSYPGVFPTPNGTRYPLAKNAMEAQKIIEAWCVVNGEQVRWSYDAARRKFTPEDLHERLIDFCGHYANTAEKQTLFFSDPARVFMNGLTKWLQTQNKFDREQAAKQPKTAKKQGTPNAFGGDQSKYQEVQKF